MLGRERWDHPGEDFQIKRDLNLLTTKEKGNSLQNGNLFPGVRRVENITEEYVYLQSGVSNVENQGIELRTAQSLTRAAPEGNLLLINLDHQLPQDESDHLRPDLTSKLGMPRSHRQEDGYIAWKLRKKVKIPM